MESSRSRLPPAPFAASCRGGRTRASTPRFTGVSYRSGNCRLFPLRSKTPSSAITTRGWSFPRHAASSARPTIPPPPLPAVPSCPSPAEPNRRTMTARVSRRKRPGKGPTPSPPARRRGWRGAREVGIRRRTPQPPLIGVDDHLPPPNRHSAPGSVARIEPQAPAIH